MKKISTLLLFSVLVFSFGCRKSTEPKELRDFSQVNLVANTAGYGAAHTDGTLLNAWGLAFSSGGTPWVNSLGGHVSEVYDAQGAPVAARPAVRIPSPADTIGGLPTGVVFSGGKGFKLSNGAASNFLFVGVDGVLSGWNGPAGNNAIRIKNNSATSSYTGLAIAASGGANYIYAADFRGGKIAVWDTTFKPVNMAFHDPSIPRGFAPFNIQSIGDWLYVTYAKVGPDGKDQAGAGEGFVNVFKTDGSWVRRLASRGSLNAPWGVAQAAPGFFGDNDNDDGDDNNNRGNDNSGKGSDNSGKGNNNNSGRGKDDDHIDTRPTILVGNFGDGHINAYSLDGKFLGQMQSHRHPLVIHGLWALSFPPVTATTIDPNRLYFTAGPNDEMDGLFGYLIKQ